MTLRAGVAGIGVAQFGDLVENQGLVDRGVDTSDEWIRSRSGIERRRFLSADDHRKTSDVGADALGIALSDAGSGVEDWLRVNFGRV